MVKYCVSESNDAGSSPVENYFFSRSGAHLHRGLFRFCIAALHRCFCIEIDADRDADGSDADCGLVCIAASASKSMQIAMQFVTSWSASLLHRFCIASASQNLLTPQASLTLGLMQIAMQMAKTDAEFCIAHLHRICIKICIGSRAGAMKRKSARVCIDFDADTMQNTMQIERCRFPTFSSLFCIG